MSYTPGPWFTRQMFSGNWDIAAENGDGKTLARTIEESDARLIAACPNMYEELRFVALSLENNKMITTADIKRIYAVLHKAEGK